jgi:hypothetical protein
MASSYELWFGKTVILRLTTGELRVPLGGIIVSESEGTVRFRVGGSWDIDVYKSLILNVEQDNGGQLHNQ